MFVWVSNTRAVCKEPALHHVLCGVYIRRSANRGTLGVGIKAPFVRELSTVPRRRMGSGCIDPLFLTSALVGGEWSTSRPGRFTPGERVPGTHWIGDWVDLGAGLDDLEKTLLRLEL
jgi:hypothetical protein